MKKITLVMAAFALVSLASCKKDYECHCKDEDDPNVPEMEKMIEGAKEDDAKQECENYEATLNGGHDHDHEGEEGDHDHAHYHCHLD